MSAASYPIGVQEGRISGRKNCVVVKLNFQDEGHFYGNPLLYILTIYCKLLFCNSEVVTYISTFAS